MYRSTRPTDLFSNSRYCSVKTRFWDGERALYKKIEKTLDFFRFVLWIFSTGCLTYSER